MKILFTLTRAVDPYEAGVQRITYNLGRFFTEKGLDVYFYSFKSGITKKTTFGTSYSFPDDGDEKKTENISHFVDTLVSIKPDIVINQMPYETALVNALARFRKKSKFLLFGCVHNSFFSFKNNVKDTLKQRFPKVASPLLTSKPVIWSVEKLHFLKHRSQLKQMLRLYDRLVLYTPANQFELKYFTKGYLSEKIAIKPNPVSSPLGELPRKEKIILHVGSIKIPQKRSDLLLEFWKNTYSYLPDWNFIIVGEGSYRKVLQKKIQQENIPRVESVGRQIPEPYYAKAAMFMMPSAFEGFPNTIIEAQSHGCLVLAFNSFLALEHIVNDGKDAFLSPPFDTQDMARQAIALANDAKQLKNAQQHSLENIKRFTIQQVGQQWLELFDSLNR